MKKFLARHGQQVLGVLSGFDRLRFRGTFRQLAHTDGMMSILDYLHVLLKNYGTFVDQTTQRFRAGMEEFAKRSDRPIEYLASPQENKEQLVQQILKERGVSRNGTIAIFSTVEVCRSYEIRHGKFRRTVSPGAAPGLFSCQRGNIDDDAPRVTLAAL